jgi:hypothetical protein
MHTMTNCPIEREGLNPSFMKILRSQIILSLSELEFFLKRSLEYLK